VSAAVPPAWGSAAPAGASFDGHELRITETIAAPIELATLVPAGAVGHQQLRIVVEAGAQVEVWESWVGDGVLDVSTELEVAEGASLRYIALQNLSEPGSSGPSAPASAGTRTSTG
jgi:hypothetical protein